MAKRRASTDLSGLLLVDKPSGMTSHDVVSLVRRVTGEGRVGHAGTLDPMATGLLVVAVGPATRLLTHLQAQRKTYHATVSLGSQTDTDDAEGQVTATAPVDPTIFSSGAAERAVRDLLGTQRQVPPAYSAIKVGGRRAYDAARSGAPIELAEREFEVTAIDEVVVDATARTVSFDIEVSKGTYIRSIARDLGVALGTLGHLSSLRRIRSGELHVSGAIGAAQLADLGADALASVALDPVMALGLPVVRAHDRDIAGGAPLALRWERGADGDLLAVASTDSRLLAVYRYEAGSPQRARPETVLGRPAAGPRLSPAVCALGVFDGVHRGHQALLRHAVARARERGVASVAFTFDPLPEAILRHPDAPRGIDTPTQLTSLEHRIALIEAAGIDEVVVVPFTAEVSSLSPVEFFERLVARRVACLEVVVGADFRFGVGASGTPATLASLVPTTVVDDVLDEYEGQRISSTRVRTALERGDLEVASRLLGRSVAVVGEVERGVALGRKLGAPTANIAAGVEGQSLRTGVYAARVRVLGGDVAAEPCTTVDRNLRAWRRSAELVAPVGAGSCTERTSHTAVADPYDAAVFIGVPSGEIADRRYVVEAHLLDRELDLYGAELHIELVTHVRDPKTFGTNEELGAAIAADLASIRSALR